MCFAQGHMPGETQPGATYIWLESVTQIINPLAVCYLQVLFHSLLGTRIPVILAGIVRES